MYRTHSSGTGIAPRRHRLGPRLAARVLRSEGAAISPMFALLLIPISGSIAYAVEVGGWHYVQRAAQNAADSAVLAAATNNVSAGNAYLLEARAAANKLGFQNVGTTSVNVASVTCPAGATAGATCYQATVATTFPRLFSKMIGFTGSSSAISAGAIASTGIAGSAGIATTSCVWAFNDLTGNGTPNANLAGCSVMSSGTMTCNGSNGLQADYALAGTSVSGPCASVPANNMTANASNGVTLPSDPYAALASNVPSAATAPCNSPPTSGTNITQTLLVYCGNVSLSGDMTLKSADTVIIVRNGTLDLNNHVLKTDSASGSAASATIIFDGNFAPFGDKNMKGTIDIKAPPKTSSSVWKGVAIYRPSTATKQDVTLAGSKATWNITGLVYLPNTNTTLSGAVNHSSTGATCMILVGSWITIDGNGQILQSTAGCDAAGLTPPGTTVGASTGTRVKLVS